MSSEINIYNPETWPNGSIVINQRGKEYRVIARNQQGLVLEQNVLWLFRDANPSLFAYSYLAKDFALFGGQNNLSLPSQPQCALEVKDE